MAFLIGALIVLVLSIVGLCYWFQGTLGGAFAGAIPITLICIFINYSDSSGHGGPTKESTNEALIVAALLTFAPYLIRLFKQFVSGDNHSRNRAGNARNAR